MKPKLQVSQQGYVCSYYCRAWSDVYVPVAYPNVSPTRMSSSLQIAELEHPDQPDSPELAVGQGHGYLWRLNNYWRLEEKDGGVYMQVETIALSRDIPAMFAWFVNPLIQRVSHQSVANLLNATRRGLAPSDRTKLLDPQTQQRRAREDAGQTVSPIVLVGR